LVFDLGMSARDVEDMPLSRLVEWKRIAIEHFDRRKGRDRG
jgi:hypothetical protein